jgi:hypothetical protein
MFTLYCVRGTGVCRRHFVGGSSVGGDTCIGYIHIASQWVYMYIRYVLIMSSWSVRGRTWVFSVEREKERERQRERQRERERERGERYREREREN